MRLSLLAAALAVACANDPVSVSATTNAAMTVELLFENDGCKVYRFEDNSRYHYYTRCRAETTTTTSTQTEPCGKNCTRAVDENIPTETR